jgi:hypothetical protein
VEQRFKRYDHLVAQQDRNIEDLARLQKFAAKRAIGAHPGSRIEGIQCIVSRLECEIRANSARLDCLGCRIRESDEKLKSELASPRLAKEERLKSEIERTRDDFGGRLVSTVRALG